MLRRFAQGVVLNRHLRPHLPLGQNLNMVRNNRGHAQHHQAPAQQASIPRVSTPPLTAPVPTDTMRFAELGAANLVDPLILRTIQDDLHFDHMMPVQAKTLRPLLERRIDCLAQAKTGTGKTIAFLLPAIQTLINRARPARGRGVSLLVISPTRELALQIAKEATALLQRMPHFHVRTAIGGTNKAPEEAGILAGCDILVATPGRLLDHLGDARMRAALRHLDTLVLDEADRLLDMGFMDALRAIVACLPDKAATARQGMLFSATIAPHVQKVAGLVLSPGYEFISTIPAGEAATHERVPQFLVTVPRFADMAAALVGALRAECAQVGAARFKTIIFAPTAAQADWYGGILEGVAGNNNNNNKNSSSNSGNGSGGVVLPAVSVLHSRKSQSARTRITDAFRGAAAAVLVATDVVARGMDFPNVTTVVQVGAPADRESYIHRLGRTARAGREGRSIFIIAAPEAFFPTHLLKDVGFEALALDAGDGGGGGGGGDGGLAAEVGRAAAAYGPKGKVYQAWLGYYKSQRGLKWSPETLVATANEFARDGLGCVEVPGLEKSTVGKMGLKGVRGLTVLPNEPRMGRGGGGGGGGEGRSVGSGGRGGLHGFGGGGRGGGGGGGGGRGGESRNNDRLDGPPGGRGGGFGGGRGGRGRGGARGGAGRGGGGRGGF